MRSPGSPSRQPQTQNEKGEDTNHDNKPNDRGINGGNHEKRKKHTIPAFLIPNNVRNINDFVRDLHAQNPEVRKGLDIKTIRSNENSSPLGL